MLNLLGGRLTAGNSKINGLIGVYGPEQDLTKNILGYVTQDEAFVETQTVFETLYFAAYLLLPASMTQQQLTDRVYDVLDDLHIRDIAHSRIGTPDRGGISGGERRRLALAVQLVSFPGILLVDEPTSGLDSFSAKTVVDVMAEIALKRRCAIIVTIHQPPDHIMRKFSKVLLLSKFGEIAYYGPVEKAVNYIESSEMVLPQDHFSIAEDLRKS
jgi:ATP-binding cassette subfamily G (WHITE) protein 8 (sterolin 2)